MATAHIAADQLAHAADTEYLVRRGMTKGYQWASLLAPPAYAAFVLTQRGRAHFSLNRLLRATWVGGAAGVVGGGGVEYVRSAYSNEHNVRARRIQAAYDTASIRTDDHSTIGGLLFALITPAILWKRASAVHLILGGAGIGSGIGLITHHVRSLSGDPPPTVVIPEIPVPTA